MFERLCVDMIKLFSAWCQKISHVCECGEASFSTGEKLACHSVPSHIQSKHFLLSNSPLGNTSVQVIAPFHSHSISLFHSHSISLLHSHSSSASLGGMPYYLRSIFSTNFLSFLHTSTHIPTTTQHPSTSSPSIHIFIHYHTLYITAKAKQASATATSTAEILRYQVC